MVSMRVLHLGGPDDIGSVGAPRVVDVDVADAARPTAELAEALRGRSCIVPHGLIVDGRWFPPATTIDQLPIRQGSTVFPSPTPPESPAPRPARTRLSRSEVRAGARAHRRATFDRPHSVEAALSATGVAALGATIPFNRPPRARPEAEPVSIEVPADAPPAPRPEPLSVAGIVLPVVAGGVIAFLWSPMMAIFTALGPILTIGTWWERRRRIRRDHRSLTRLADEALADLGRHLPTARKREEQRRRSLVPDLEEVTRRATAASVRVWERRTGDLDSFLCGVGAATIPFEPRRNVVEAGSGRRASTSDATTKAADAMLAASPALADVPMELSLGAGSVVGLVGPSNLTRAVARSLVVQTTTHHGPADLTLMVQCESEPVRRPWDWCRWLPHTADPTTGEPGVLVAHSPAHEPSLDVDRGRPAGGTNGHEVLLAVLDGDHCFHGRAATGRRLVGMPDTAILALVSDPHRLPAECTSMVRMGDAGRIVVVDPRTADEGCTGIAWGLAPAAAEGAARRLGQLDDPERVVEGADLPDSVNLLDLLARDGDVAQPDPADAIRRRWQRGLVESAPSSLAVTIGADAHGPVDLDLVADGPHLVIGGTTGSGKSELLRTLVASTAAVASPDAVAMVLVDYKGGAAFDCCVDLPHVVGVVTDLDEALAARALRCLEAELRHRERTLRAAGADDLDAYVARARLTRESRRAAIEPLPRLLVVIDEFASLAADLPDFMSSLVGIAQRGRSLGVHLVLATQRPAGVITEDIRANTGARIALRVTDRADSTDVVGSPDAATIPRARPGQALLRLGPGELVRFQTALVTGRTTAGAAVRVRPIAGDESVASAVAAPATARTDLAALVAAIGEAHGASARPRIPWPEPLPAREIDTGPTWAHGWCLVDDPDNQRVYREGWTPGDGHLVVVGGPGSGRTTTLGAAALVSVDSGAHVYVIDLDGGVLAELEVLAPVGAAVAPADTERRRRLLRRLDEEVVRRRSTGAGGSPEIVLVIDDLGGLSRAHDPVRDTEPHDQLERIWADGPAVGVYIAASVGRVADLPAAMLASAGTVLVHPTLDGNDSLRFGVAPLDSDSPPGRARRAIDGAELQVVLPAEHLSDAVGARTEKQSDPAPFQIGVLGTDIPKESIAAAACVDASSITIDIGVAERDLEPSRLRFRRGDHALVLGPRRSGRTTALATMATLAVTAGVEVAVVGSAGLADRIGAPLVSPGQLPSRRELGPPLLLVVDDCVESDDSSGVLAGIVTRPPDGVHLLVAARTDRFRAAYGHWSAELRSASLGIILRPDPLDGDLLGVPLPPRLALAPVPGRGVLIDDGHVAAVQLVH